MTDIWGFLFQALTASGVALLLLVLKALFKDKLPPKWHFCLWGVLGILLLIPAGWNGRYALIRWQVVVEWLRSALGDFSITRVYAPFPAVIALPKTAADWVFLLYFAGVLLHLGIYLCSYLRLRRILKKGSAPSPEIRERVHALAKHLHTKPCPVVAIRDLPGAFVCGVFRPVLAVPAEERVDDKILLHEMLHLRARDTLWSVVICILRSIHWCNPLLVFCAGAATNDMEYRCDQFVLERLEGEERRQYGQLLLSMVNERFARTPGTTCVNNGGKHIRDRIETIARFKKYPAGMGLVSVCVLVILTFCLGIGVQATRMEPFTGSHLAQFASARSVLCTTYAGAFDAYGRSVLEQNGYYRVMCAPEALQEQVYHQIWERTEKGRFPQWDPGLPCWPDVQEGYYVYNLEQPEKGVYEGLMVFRLNYPPDGKPGEEGKLWLAVQNLQVRKENGRWVAIPLEDFRCIEAAEQSLDWGCTELPGIHYTGTAGDLRLDVTVQTVHRVESTGGAPQPGTDFTRANRTQTEQVTHLGTQAQRDSITTVGFSLGPVYPGGPKPDHLPRILGENASASDMAGYSRSNRRVDPGWGPVLTFGGGGGSLMPDQEAALPESFVAELYTDQTSAQLELLRAEEVAS